MPVVPVVQAKAKSSTPIPPESEFEFSDTVAMTCLLCARQFKTMDQLKRHNKESDLHKVSITSPHLLNNTDHWRYRKTTTTRASENLPRRKPRQQKQKLSSLSIATGRLSGGLCTINLIPLFLRTALRSLPRQGRRDLQKDPRRLPRLHRRRSIRVRTQPMLVTSCCERWAGRRAQVWVRMVKAEWSQCRPCPVIATV